MIARRDGTQDAARSVMGEFVSGNYFRTFGLRPQAGRLLTDADDVAGAPMVAVMSYETWQHDYAGDASVVGSTFWINTKAVTIAGIAPEGFFGDRLSSTPPDFYLPIETMPVLANVPYVHDPEASWLYMVGRVKPGVSMAALQAEGERAGAAVACGTREVLPIPKIRRCWPKVHVVLTPGGGGHSEHAGALRVEPAPADVDLRAVLLIACANIANLLLVRGMGRKAEMSVRTALGATRGQIIRQLLTESVLLAGLGGIAGLGCRVCGDADAADAGVSGSAERSDPGESVAGGAWGLRAGCRC